MKNMQVTAGVCYGLLLATCTNSFAWGIFDPLNSEKGLTQTPLTSRQSWSDKIVECEFGELENPLKLLDVIDRALCNSPQSRQAWATTKVQAAQLGLSRSAYLPTIKGTGIRASTNGESYIAGLQAGVVRGSAETFSRTYELNWLLFDFGRREANITQSRELLFAALAAQDTTLQAAMADAAQSYFEAFAARSAVISAQAAEKHARESLAATIARLGAGTGTRTDVAQAKANASQTILNRIKFEGELRNTVGVLAIRMGLNANTPLQLALEVAQKVEPIKKTLALNEEFVRSVDEMIAQALLDHPSLIAAKAQLYAAEAKLSATIRQGLPSISLTANNKESSQSPIFTGQTIIPKTRSIGLVLEIPLFEGFGRLYQVKGAMSQVDIQEANLQSVEQQISLAIWQSYQNFKTQTEALNASFDFVLSAQDAFERSRERYAAGLGTVIELLNAQSALASAELQDVQNNTNWYIARIKLAQSLGKLSRMTIG